MHSFCHFEIVLTFWYEAIIINREISFVISNKYD